MSRVGVVVVTWNSEMTLEQCLASIPPGVPVAVVDNASSDQSLAVAARVRPDALLMSQTRNLGFGAGCNLGVAALSCLDIMLLNPDAALEDGALDHLCEQLAGDPAIGAVGPAIFDPEGILEYSWGQDPTLWSERRRSREQASFDRPRPSRQFVDWVTGGCCLVRRAAWERVGGFDTGYFLYFEDLDLCRRIRLAGYRILYDPAATALHARGVSGRQLGASTERFYRASQLRYYGIYGGLDVLGLRAYLMVKYLLKAFRSPMQARPALRIVGMVLGLRP